jgi:two-component system NtrC family sensor kinase
MSNKIGFKLIVAVGLTAIIIIGVFAFFNIQRQSNALLAEVERHANQLSETVISSTRYDMLLNQRDRIDKTITSIGNQQGIRFVRILNKQGEIIYSSQKNDVSKMVDKKTESCYACHAANRPLERLAINQRTRIYRTNQDSSRILGIITPIYNEQSCWEADCHAHAKDKTILGVLDVTTSLAEADHEIKRGEIEIVIFALAAIVALSFIIGFLVKRWIDKPVNELLKATDQVGVGNLNYTIKEKGNDELGKLARSFNTMTQKLSEARLQLFQSDKLASLGRLAAGVAHEINNPLTGVLTYSSFLLKRTQDNPELQEDLKVIVRETKRSREIVKSLLDFARQSVPKKNNLEINEVIEQAISVVDNQLTINHVKLEKNLDKSIPQIVADANQIQQVFINLLVNANDAIGKKGGTITVSTSSLSLAPYGITHIKKAICPKRHDLIDSEFKIEGLPSIKLKAKFNGKEDIIHLDPVYGRRAHKYPKEMDGVKKINVLCPQCNISMIEENSKCPKCGSPLFSIPVPSESNFEACTRIGCDFQRWESVDEAGKRDFIEIKISDTGCGIPKDEISRIFEPFYSTKGQKGTGLGLAVIWGIIDNHNGTIKVESEIKKGTTFIIRLPIKQK